MDERGRIRRGKSDSEKKSDTEMTKSGMRKERERGSLASRPSLLRFQHVPSPDN